MHLYGNNIITYAYVYSYVITNASMSPLQCMLYTTYVIAPYLWLID